MAALDRNYGGVDDLRRVSLVRHEIRAALLDEGLPADVVDRLELIASELMTNAVVHSRSPAELTLRGRDGSLVIRVCDHGAGWPVVRAADVTRIGGLGLRIVADLADSWSVDPLVGGGKAVWAQIDLPLSGAPTPQT